MYPHTKPVSFSGFQSFVSGANLEEKGLKLTELRRLPNSNQVSIAFDGTRLLDEIVQDVQKTCPLTIFTATMPFSAYEVVDRYESLLIDLRKLFSASDAEFKAMFVFNGCGFALFDYQDTTSPAPPTEMAAFKAHDREKTVLTVPADIQRKFASRFVIEDDVEAAIVRCISRLPAETMRAPYLAWSQISSFFAVANQLASEVYGSLEMLAFPGVDRVITNINVAAQTFDCVSKAAVMAALRRRYEGDFTEEEFAALVLFESKNRIFRLKVRSETFEDLCRLPRDPTRIDGFMKQDRFREDQKRLMLRNLGALDAPVFTVNAELVPLSSLYDMALRCNIGAVFGTPMPTAFFYLFMSGPLLPLPYAIYGQGLLTDDWPLIDTPAYRRAAEAILSVRVQAVFQLYCLPLTPKPFYWMRRYIVLKKHQSPVEPMARVCKLTDPPVIRLAFWDIDEKQLMELIQDESHDKHVCLSDVAPFCGKAVGADLVYTSIETTVAAVFLRSLDFLGYFTHATDSVEASGPSLYCKALACFTCPTLSEYGALVIEMLRTGTLSDAPLVVLLGQPAEDYDVGVRFASRMVSVVPMNIEGPWTGPFDAEMAAFGVISRLFSQTLRVLFELVATALFVKKGTLVPWDEFNEVVKRLPFSTPSEFSAGFIMTYILRNENCTLDELQTVFPELYNLEDDVSVMFWFFSLSFEAMRVINYEEPLPDKLVNVANAAKQKVTEACARLCPEVHALYFQMDDMCVVKLQPPPTRMDGAGPINMQAPMPDSMPLPSDLNNMIPYPNTQGY